jgi:hypothetical protein
MENLFFPINHKNSEENKISKPEVTYLYIGHSSFSGSAPSGHQVSSLPWYVHRLPFSHLGNIGLDILPKPSLSLGLYHFPQPETQELAQKEKRMTEILTCLPKICSFN